jgi:putative glycosyltransferase (TIGR04372 family)
VVLVHFASAAIGRLLPEAEEFFAETTSMRKTKFYGFCDKSKANTLFVSYIKSKVKVMPNPIMVRVFSKMRSRQLENTNLSIYVHGQGHFYPFSMNDRNQVKDDVWNFVEKKSAEFPSFELPEKPYVVLCVREPTKPEVNDNLRNTSPSSFIPIVNYLSTLGMNCVRMSRSANFKLDPGNASLIDYPFTDFKSDFADFTLFKSAEFCISTGFGVDHFASFFGIPVLAMNAPLMATYLRKEKRYILPKIFVDIQSNKVLSVDEILSKELHLIEKDSELKSLGYALIDNPPSVMTNAIKEFHENKYFLEISESTVSKNEAKRIAVARYEYHRMYFQEKELKYEKEFDLKNLIYISAFWPNLTNAGKVVNGSL